MDDKHPPALVPSHPFRWFPEFLEIVRRRSRSQTRVLAAAMLVGIVAGCGAVVFAIACQAVVRVSLDGVAGYRSEGPDGEAKALEVPVD